MSDANLKVEWFDRGVEPQCSPDPNFPEGVDLDMTMPGNVRTCQTALPYPAKRCGYYLVSCSLCGLSCLVSTAGRPDDPRTVKVGCKTIAGRAA